MEELLDEKIHKYNKFNENHPMQGISWNDKQNKYILQYENISTSSVNLNNLCDKIFFNYDGFLNDFQKFSQQKIYVKK